MPMSSPNTGSQHRTSSFQTCKRRWPRLCRDIKAETDLSKVSVVGLGMRSHAGVALKMFEILARENVHVHLISTSEIKISCVIEGKHAELAVRALHDGFELGKR
jgi:aspartate kinase